MIRSLHTAGIFAGDHNGLTTATLSVMTVSLMHAFCRYMSAPDTAAVAKQCSASLSCTICSTSPAMPMTSQQSASIRLDSPEDPPHKHTGSNVAQSSLHDSQPEAQRECVAKVEGGLQRTKRSCSQEQQPASEEDTGDCCGINPDLNAFAEVASRTEIAALLSVAWRTMKASLCTTKLPQKWQSLRDL